ncbi:hypothetical protein B0T16DRAFT_458619 [Cercophora newfieldiana]|uniref:Uncharacterized protein n=1 Tax=Cercophora newfieldiana TaxID=92897 RepID=A0AA39Y6Q3_9PEZI|nr:hypothetical protein B0T16DRAFT_458619 [Cercophora newfieldiana]
MTTNLNERAYGCLPDDPTKPVLRFNSIIRRRVVEGDISVDAPAPKFADIVDNIAPLSGWDILGNNYFGTCVPATWANHRRMVTSRLSKKEVYPGVKDVFTLYKTSPANKDFDPSPEKYKKSNDNGMNFQALLDYLREHGGPDGVKVVAHAKIDPGDVQAVRQAIQILGSVWVRMECLQDINNEKIRLGEDDGNQVFTNVTGPVRKVGHSVLVGGHVPRMRCVTWGQVWEFEDACWDPKSQRVTDVWAVIWPEHLGTQSFMLGVSLDLLAKEVKRLTRENLAIPPANFSDIYFIKTNSTQSGKIEVHVAAAKDNYRAPNTSQTGAVHATPLDPKALQGVTLDIDNGDLYLIKTTNTNSGKVEISHLPADSKYQAAETPRPTAFNPSDAPNGRFIVDDGNLFFIKTKNTPNNLVEVHRAARPDYKIVETYPTTIPLSDSANGTFAVFAGNLYFIKHKQTKDKFVEVYVYWGSDKYRQASGTYYKTAMGVAEGPNGTWDVGPNQDLYLIKQRNVNTTKKVEVHICPRGPQGAAQKYAASSHYETWVAEGDGAKGVWCAR